MERVAALGAVLLVGIVITEGSGNMLSLLTLEVRRGVRRGQDSGNMLLTLEVCRGVW